jgi:hypothetical protein
MADKYEVGYRKPPKRHQFRKGQSGNPTGRSTGTRTLKADLLEELAQQIPIRESGRSMKTTKQRALIKSLLAKALNGDMRASNTLFNMYLRFVALSELTEDIERPLNETEQETLAVLEECLLRKALAKEKHGRGAGEEE